MNLDHNRTWTQEHGLSRRAFLFGLLGLACLKLPEAQGKTGFEPFSFAYVTDVHLANGLPDSYRLVHESQLFLQELVKVLNQQKLDFVMFGGDQVEVLGNDESNWNMFLDILQGLNAPWSFVLGERDLADNLPVDKMKTYGPDWKGRGIETTKPYWSHDPLPGVHLIGLDTSLSNSVTGDMSPRQVDWLKADLAKSTGKFTIIVSHHPLLPPLPYDGGPPWDEYILTQGPAVREILGGFPDVHLCLSGHVPISKIQQEGSIWYVSGPSLNVFPCSFRLFSVRPDAITVETRQLAFGALVKKARKALASSELAYKFNRAKPDAFAELAEGKDLDRNALLALSRNAAARPLERKHKKQAEQESTPEDKEPEKSRPKSKTPGTDSMPETDGTTSPAVKSSPPGQRQDKASKSTSGNNVSAGVGAGAGRSPADLKPSENDK